MHICLANCGLCARKAVANLSACARYLSQRRVKPLTVEVLNLEDARTRLRRSTLQLGRMDLDEAFGVEVVAEQLADARLQAEDGLVGGCLKGV
jgi:hypothetical protein